jgi:putative transposase
LKYAHIDQQRGTWPIRALCRMLTVSPSGFYEWRGRGPSRQVQEDARLTARIEASFVASGRTYGSPRVWHDLREGGERCGRNRVIRLMRQAQLQGRRKRRRLPTDGRLRAPQAMAANHLQRDFTADRPNHKWVADFTYLWTGQGWLFVAVVMDLYSRRIVGWSMSDAMDGRMVVDALQMAIGQRGKPIGLLHHSDQGRQYTSDDFQTLLASQGITCSMSRRGNCWDNAAIESFFSSLKTERTSKTNYLARDEARTDVFDYIERFYNRQRKHSTLNYTTPVQFENRALG